MKIKLRRTVDAEAARNAGWTKNHFFVEMYVVGKWRAVGFYTNAQILKGVAEERAAHLIAWNAKGVEVHGFEWQEVGALA